MGSFGYYDSPKEVSEMKKLKSRPFQAILADYGVSLKSQGLTVNTSITYMTAAKQFVSCHSGISRLGEISQKSVDRFLSQFNARRGTLSLKQIATRRFLEYLKAEYRFTNKINIKVKNAVRQEPEFLSVEEQDRLIQYLRGFGELSIYFVLFKLLLFSGLRISEVLNLKFSDVTPTGLVLRHTKHGGLRRKQLKQEIIRMLKMYLNARRQKYPMNELPSSPEDYIFVTKYKGRYQPFSRQGVNSMVKRFAKKVGITKKISPHTLRHSFSLRFLNHGGSLLGLQKILGHRDLKTTSFYLHLADGQLTEELERI
jgi:integrase/recombinase XerD